MLDSNGSTLNWSLMNTIGVNVYETNSVLISSLLVAMATLL